MINVPVSKGIKDADQLIEEALRGSLIAENKTVDALEQADGEWLPESDIVFIKI